ncbi:MAG: hypothetical protein ACRDLN_12460, partial [Solirubrobacteraceae bacterium]
VVAHHRCTPTACLYRQSYTSKGYTSALGATDEAADFYAARGWQAWRGPTSALTPGGVVRTADEDGSVHVLALAHPLDLSGELTCDWRDGDVW